MKGPCAWVKVEGRADFHFSEVLKKLAYGLADQGSSHILLEFTHCFLMDSTFAGTLARLGREFAKPRSGRPNPTLCLLNANQRIADTLANLGVIQLFQLLQQATPEAREFTVVDSGDHQPNRKELTRAMLDAHCALVEINPANFEKFKDVLKFLDENLKKLEGESKTDQTGPKT